MSNLRLRAKAGSARPPRRAGMVCFWAVGWLLLAGGVQLRAAESAAITDPVLAAHYHVRGYVIEGKAELSTNLLYPLLAQYTGKNVRMAEIVRAAADLQFEYGRQGWPTMNIVIAPKRIARGLVTLDVFEGAVAQILVAGTRYLVTGTNVVAATPPATAPPAEAMAQLTAETNGAPHTVAPNTGPKFTVHNYLVLGNTVLPPELIGRTLTNVPDAFGTNVTIDGIKAAATELQGAYRARGYVTVAVSLPPQRLTNAVVKMQVTEGRLASIEIKGNHYYSSNNIMRALPGLHTNEILNGLTFQEELNRANASQDRQIYPVIGPGPDPGTSDLTLKIKDRFPFHAKVEFNNESSPGTPDLRLNSSAVLGNLWQLEQSAGLQYSFSPESYKGGPEWNFYDRPLVANYSGFYRMPLAGPESIDDAVASNPGSFGYNEATRKFILPPASGEPDLTFFASRSTIDTGVQQLSSEDLTPGATVDQIFRNISQQDLTVNNDLGARLNTPLKSTSDFHSDLASGFDYKSYQINSYKTNTFIIDQQVYNIYTLKTNTIVSTVPSPAPATVHPLDYLPLSVRYNASLQDARGVSIFDLGLSYNFWHSGSRSNLQSITSSTQSSGHWVVLTPSFTRRLELFTNWVTLFRADGQWASEPLISNEQFGAGGVNSVRGYQEGQVFGDTGWHVSLEQQTPPHIAGFVRNVPLTIRGSIYTDYADTYLLDPPAGEAGSTALWGAGVGGVATLGSHWEARCWASPARRLTRPFLIFH